MPPDLSVIGAFGAQFPKFYVWTKKKDTSKNTFKSEKTEKGTDRIY